MRTLKFSPAYSPVEWFECSAIANFPRALILAGGWPRKALGADGVLDVCDRFCVAACIIIRYTSVSQVPISHAHPPYAHPSILHTPIPFTPIPYINILANMMAFPMWYKGE